MSRPLPVSFQIKSTNRKLAPVLFEPVPGSRRKRPVAIGPFCCSTYVSIEATCPSHCAFRDNGCYADGVAGYSPTRKLDKAAKGWTASRTTTAEAALIDEQFPNGVPQDGWKGRGRDLRLHISGEVSGSAGARSLAAAAWGWHLRGGGAVWTYTHRWREVPFAAWGKKLSAVASCETIEDINDAHGLGYGASITLVAFPDHRPFQVPGTDFKIMPCPAEVQGKTCVECRLCMRSSWLNERKLVIGFSIHGRDSRRAKNRLRVIQGDSFDEVPFKLLPQTTRKQRRR